MSHILKTYPENRTTKFISKIDQLLFKLLPFETALPPHVPIAEGKEGESAGHLARLW